MSVLRSRDNARVRRWSRLARDARLRREERRVLIEGPHLLAALLDSGSQPIAVLVTERALERGEIGELLRRARIEPVVLGERAFRSVAEAEAPQGIAAEIELPAGPRRTGDALFLEGIQDAGNVGAILRSAAAFGAARVVLDRACADPWSPKALRAGMGGHFRLGIESTAELDREIDRFAGTTLCALPRGGMALSEAPLTGPLGWIFGGEGTGLSPRVRALARLRVTIPMPGGAESLNVAVAAAICLYEAARRR